MRSCLLARARAPFPTLQHRYGRAVANVKLAAISIVDVFVNFQVTARMEQFFLHFKQVYCEQTGEDAGLAGLATRNIPHEHATALRRMLETQPSRDLDADRDVIRSYVSALFDSINYINPGWRPDKTGARHGDQDDLIEILLDLAKYQYNDLTCRALQLIDRLYSGAEELFLDAIHAEVVVEPESLTLSAYMAQKMPNIRRLCAGEIQEGEEEATFVELLQHLINECKLDSHHVHEVGSFCLRGCRGVVGLR